MAFGCITRVFKWGTHGSMVRWRYAVKIDYEQDVEKQAGTAGPRKPYQPLLQTLMKTKSTV